MRIGLFGCTCDPIHFGHLNLAQEVLEKKNLDEIWLFPTGVNPFKVGQVSAAAEQRQKMAELATESFPNIHVRDDEIKRVGVSYAIDTVRTLQEMFDHEFFLIIGDDAAEKLIYWKDIDELKHRVEIVVGTRHAEAGLKIRTLEISSSSIRERLQKGLPCAHLLPQTVIDYIQKEKIYV